ncbi:hypothetical protein V1477_008557, partial [Vespula maculifrons]
MAAYCRVWTAMNLWSNQSKGAFALEQQLKLALEDIVRATTNKDINRAAREPRGEGEGSDDGDDDDDEWEGVASRGGEKEADLSSYFFTMFPDDDDDDDDDGDDDDDDDDDDNDEDDDRREKLLLEIDDYDGTDLTALRDSFLNECKMLL